MKQSIAYGDASFDYTVSHNPRLSSKVRIHVHPDGVIEVEAPPGQSGREVQSAVQKRAGWITRRVREATAAKVYALPRHYVSGETHFYLGRRYQLKIIETRSEPSSVALKGGQIRVTLRSFDKAAVRRRLRAWYLERAEDYLAARLSAVAEGIGWLKTAPPMKLATMRKQWGSCSPSGSINLNPWLIRAPRDCIDYVITHELCHLREHNHSKRYYALLDKQLPEWRAIKARLDHMAELLLAE